MLWLRKTVLFCAVISRATHFFLEALKYMPTCGHSHTQAHTLERLGGVEAHFSAKEGKSLGSYLQTRPVCMHLDAGDLPSVHVNYSNSHQSQGVTGERSKESKCHITEFLLLATANKTADGLFPYGNKKYKSQFFKMTRAYRTLTPLQAPRKFSE